MACYYFFIFLFLFYAPDAVWLIYKITCFFFSNTKQIVVVVPYR